MPSDMQGWGGGCCEKCGHILRREKSERKQRKELSSCCQTGKRHVPPLSPSQLGFRFQLPLGQRGLSHHNTNNFQKVLNIASSDSERQGNCSEPPPPNFFKVSLSLCPCLWWGGKLCDWATPPPPSSHLPPPQGHLPSTPYLTSTVQFPHQRNFKHKATAAERFWGDIKALQGKCWALKVFIYR